MTMIRTRYNGELRLKDVDQKVDLVGWVSRVRNFGSMVFVDLRDTTGIVQVVFDRPLSDDLKIGREYLIAVHGIVQKRRDINHNIATGEIEIRVASYEIISQSIVPPMLVEDKTDALEETRLVYRYLDLRRPVLQNTIKFRSRVMQIIRQFLSEHQFVEIDTPLLTLSTPEGARDYIVPSRLEPGSFYALPQSPQIYKQLLMVAGFERYFQMAHCLRDEDLRADRQPEFMQLDLETSFLDENELQSLIEQLLAHTFQESIGYKIPLPLTKMTYHDAIRLYGSDKPDTRFALLLADCPFVQDCAFPGFHGKIVRHIVVPNNPEYFSRKTQDILNLEAKKFGVDNLVFLKIKDGLLDGSFAKFFTPEIGAKLIQNLELKDGDTLVISSGTSYQRVSELLGAVRLQIARALNLIDEAAYAALWVCDFPLFEYSEEEGRHVAMHHPFTRPKTEDLPFLDSHPEKVHASAYDLVINGYEAAGGSLRIYDPQIQKKIFEILKLSDEEIEKKFGWFVRAFNYGTPPHGGIAFGLDRLIMLLTKTNNIRDVIAFPKNLRAVDPMSNAPQKVDEKQLEELKIRIID